MTKTTQTWIAGIIIALVIVGVVSYSSIKISNSTIGNQLATSTPSAPVQVIKNVPYGKVSLKVGETAVFDTMSLKLLRVTEDSRCAEGVQCIWAGTLKIEVETVSDIGTSLSIIEIGKWMTTEAQKIVFVSAAPYPKVGTTILLSQYVATFDVSSHNTGSASKGACYIGGCSGEVCSDQEGMVSSCIYKPEFACYGKTSICKRQATGKCGWTETEELKVCLNASAL